MDWRGELTGSGKDIFGGTEPKSLRNAYGQPDNTEEKVEHDKANGELENARVPSR